MKVSILLIWFVFLKMEETHIMRFFFQIALFLKFCNLKNDYCEVIRPCPQLSNYNLKEIFTFDYRTEPESEQLFFTSLEKFFCTPRGFMDFILAYSVKAL